MDPVTYITNELAAAQTQLTNLTQQLQNDQDAVNDAQATVNTLTAILATLQAPAVVSAISAASTQIDPNASVSPDSGVSVPAAIIPQ